MDDEQFWDLMRKRMREALESTNRLWARRTSPGLAWHHRMEKIYEHDALSFENYQRIANAHLQRASGLSAATLQREYRLLLDRQATLQAGCAPLSSKT